MNTQPLEMYVWQYTPGKELPINIKEYQDDDAKEGNRTYGILHLHDSDLLLEAGDWIVSIMPVAELLLYDYLLVLTDEQYQRLLPYRYKAKSEAQV